MDRSREFWFLMRGSLIGYACFTLGLANMGQEQTGIGLTQMAAGYACLLLAEAGLMKGTR